jgi:hypothetical protein
MLRFSKTLRMATPNMDFLSACNACGGCYLRLLSPISIMSSRAPYLLLKGRVENGGIPHAGLSAISPLL